MFSSLAAAGWQFRPLRREREERRDGRQAHKGNQHDGKKSAQWLNCIWRLSRYVHRTIAAISLLRQPGILGRFGKAGAARSQQRYFGYSNVQAIHVTNGMASRMIAPVESCCTNRYARLFLISDDKQSKYRGVATVGVLIFKGAQDV